MRARHVHFMLMIRLSTMRLMISFLGGSIDLAVHFMKVCKHATLEH